MIVRAAKRVNNWVNLVYLNGYIFFKVKGFIYQCEVITSF